MSSAKTPPTAAVHPVAPQVVAHEVELECSIDKLNPHDRNPREGDVDAIYESMKSVGFYGYIIAHKATGKIIVGNHRYKAALRHGMTAVPVVWLDCSEEDATRILVADNRTSDIAGYNDALLADLLRDMNRTERGLMGTGYDVADLDELLADLQAKTLPPEDQGAAANDGATNEHRCPNCGAFLSKELLRGVARGGKKGKA